MDRYLAELFRWPFNAGETFALALLAAGIAYVCFFVEPDTSHHHDDRSSED